ncbi:MAG: hypothetical protein KGL35_18925, partial [Bradyrhizobium sp.]|nr:hypothetical protein [Bradyrhizobium sp.]
MRVACYYEPASRRSLLVAEAMAQGVAAAGDRASLIPGLKDQPVTHDAAVASGWGCPRLFEAYRQAGKHFVYADLGWWDRKSPGSAYGGFHKVVVDAREPNGYFRRNLPASRFERFDVAIQPWRRSGSHILLAGMSEKSAGTRGYGPQEWERATIEAIRTITVRPIVYRPKPSWLGATPIPGAWYSGPEETIERALRDCWLVATLHSNVAVDALLAGIPVNAREGVATDFSTPLAKIESPLYPDGREGLMADIAWIQWSLAEM